MIDRSDEIKRVLVTGITGSAGHYLIDYLRSEHPNVEIHGTTRRKNLKTPIPGVRLHEVDLLDFGSITSCLWVSQPDVIFHFAANSDKGFEIPSAILHNNAVGTANLFGAVRSLQHENNPTVVNVSSSEVYGDVHPEDLPIRESCPMRPMSPYAISKVAQDHLGRMYFKAYGLRVVTTRAFSYVNLYHKGIFTSAFARQIALIEAGKIPPVVRHGNLDSVRVFVDTKDIMRAYWLAATRCRFGEAYNIGGSYQATVGYILDKMLRISRLRHESLPFELEQDPGLLRPADVTLQIPDCSKFKNETGWTEKFDVDRVLLDLLDHYRKEVGRC